MKFANATIHACPFPCASKVTTSVTWVDVTSVLSNRRLKSAICSFAQVSDHMSD